MMAFAPFGEKINTPSKSSLLIILYDFISDVWRVLTIPLLVCLVTNKFSGETLNSSNSN